MLSKLSVSYISLRFRLGWDGDKFWWTLNKSRKNVVVVDVVVRRKNVSLCVFFGEKQIIQRNMFSPTLCWRRAVQLKGRKSCFPNAHAAGPTCCFSAVGKTRLIVCACQERLLLGGVNQTSFVYCAPSFVWRYAFSLIVLALPVQCPGLGSWSRLGNRPVPMLADYYAPQLLEKPWLFSGFSGLFLGPYKPGREDHQSELLPK